MKTLRQWQQRLDALRSQLAGEGKDSSEELDQLAEDQIDQFDKTLLQPVKMVGRQ